MKYFLKYEEFLNEDRFSEINILDWDDVKEIIPKGTIFTVVDCLSRKSWKMKRTTGLLHADVEPLTKSDYEIINSLYKTPKSFESVDYYPVFIVIYGFKIAAAFMSFPHGGSLATKPGTKTDKLTGNVGTINGNWIKNNGAVGHYCLHFRNSLKHTDKKSDDKAQQAILNVK